MSRMIAVVGVFTISAHAFAAPPQVTKAAPDDGAAAVDPATRKIVITFDQDMSPGGMSVVGGGEEFPNITEKPSWKNARTFVIPVQLEPEHDYQLSINSDRFQNFKNPAGESAVPYPIRFRTAAAGKPVKAAKAAPAKKAANQAANAAAIEKLTEALTKHYSHRDRLKLDWPALIKAQRKALAAAATPAEFAFKAMKLLAQANDKHILVEANGKRAPAYVNPVRPNVNPKTLPKIVPNWRALNDLIAVGRWPDGIGYLAINSLDHEQAAQLLPVFEALGELHDARALIIDLRFNGGGDERIAREIAGCFLDKPAVYARRDRVDPQRPGEFTAPYDSIVEPSKQRPQYRGQVAVLIGPAVISSCESFALMLKQVPGAVLVGAPTQGSSGNPQPHDLGNGVTVYLPSWREMTPEGAPLEGVGVKPDVDVPAKPEDFAQGDPVIDAALARLRQ
jgi:hypothetical protein